MILDFFKMNATGSDFLMVDNRRYHFEPTAQDICWLCDRHAGVGAAGVILLEESSGKSDSVAFRMRLFMADGRERPAGAHSARAFARFASAFASSELDPIDFENEEHIIHAEFNGDDVCVTMPALDQYSFRAMSVRGEHGKRLCLVEASTTNVCVPVSDVRVINVRELGRSLCQDESLSSSHTYVNFVQILEDRHLAIRSYSARHSAEYPCTGDGVLSAVLSAIHSEHWEKGPVHVRINGIYDVLVNYEMEGAFSLRKMQISAPVDFIFEGAIELFPVNPRWGG